MDYFIKKKIFFASNQILFQASFYRIDYDKWHEITALFLLYTLYNVATK